MGGTYPVLVTATDPVRGCELWKLDRRRARPQLVADLEAVALYLGSLQ